MKTQSISYEVNQPDIDDYELNYPRVRCNTPEKKIIFDLITDAKNISEALVFIKTTGSSPIVFYEKKIREAVTKGELSELDWHRKQFAGTVICLVMLRNGWKKSGRKQRFSKGLFKSGEIYIESN